MALGEYIPVPPEWEMQLMVIEAGVCVWGGHLPTHTHTHTLLHLCSDDRQDVAH